MLFAVVDETQLLSSAIAAVAGALGGGGLVAWRKAPVEQESIAVETARELVKTMSDELGRKQIELAEMGARHLAEIARRETEIKTLRDRVDSLDNHLARVVDEPPNHLA